MNIGLIKERSRQVLLVHPGTQYAPRLAAEFAHRGLLHRYWTGFGVPEHGWLAKLLAIAPEAMRQCCANRRLPNLSPERVCLRPHIEFAALLSLRRRGAVPNEVLHRRNARFQRAIPKRELVAAEYVVGFDTSSWILAERCRELERPFILDQSIAHPRAKEDVYAGLRRDFPAWEIDIERKREGIVAVEEREHSAARHIVVASSFTRRTLLRAGIAAEKISVIPYGVDATSFIPAEGARSMRPFRFAFVGLVSARKGIPLLLDVWRQLADVSAELWLIGPVPEVVQPLLPQLPRLKIWGAQPHHRVAELLRQCDVLVFPSFFEGFGLVILEAMASGLPVITTDATAGPDVLDSNSGVIVPAGDAARLAEAMEYFTRHPAVAAEMGRAARRQSERMSWKIYGDKWTAVLEGLGS